MDAFKCATMDHDKYDIKLEGSVLVIERLTYPRLIVRVDYFDPFLPLETVKVIEKADPASVEEAVNEIRQYLELMA